MFHPKRSHMGLVVLSRLFKLCMDCENRCYHFFNVPLFNVYGRILKFTWILIAFNILTDSNLKRHIGILCFYLCSLLLFSIKCFSRQSPQKAYRYCKHFVCSLKAIFIRFISVSFIIFERKNIIFVMLCCKINIAQVCE